MNIVFKQISKTSQVLIVIILFIGILNILILSSVIKEVQSKQQIKKTELKYEEKKVSEKEDCISLDKSEKIISTSCKSADFADIA